MSGTRSPSALVPFLFFLGRVRDPTKIDYRKKSGTLILTSLLEDLGKRVNEKHGFPQETGANFAALGERDDASACDPGLPFADASFQVCQGLIASSGQV